MAGQSRCKAITSLSQLFLRKNVLLTITYSRLNMPEIFTSGY